MTIEREQFEDDLADVAEGRTRVDEVTQQNFSHPAVPVRVSDPVAVQELPCVSGGTFSKSFGTGQPAAKLLGEDPKRARATIVATAPVFLGTDQATVSEGTAAVWPANLPLILRANEVWWCKAQAADATVSVLVDQWSV